MTLRQRFWLAALDVLELAERWCRRASLWALSKASETVDWEEEER